MAPHDGHLPGGKAKSFLLLEGCIVFFIEDDQPQFWRWRKECRPRAEENLALPPLKPGPCIQSLTFR